MDYGASLRTFSDRIAVSRDDSNQATSLELLVMALAQHNVVIMPLISKCRIARNDPDLFGEASDRKARSHFTDSRAG